MKFGTIYTAVNLTNGKRHTGQTINTLSHIGYNLTTDGNSKKGLSPTNTSGFKCVSWNKVTRKWNVRFNSKYYDPFDNPKDAACCYDEVAIDIFCKKNCTTNSDLGLI